MLEYIKQEADMTTTENGAVTYASTGSQCLDLFATIGALRRQSLLVSFELTQRKRIWP